MKMTRMLVLMCLAVFVSLGSAAALDFSLSLPAGLSVSTTGDMFRRIGEKGFGDSANSYSWSVQWFKGDLYVGTNRHHLYSMLGALESLLGGSDLDFSFPPG